MLLDDWLTILDPSTVFLPKERRRMLLVGNIYGHKTVKDGSRIKTSPIVSISPTSSPTCLLFTTTSGSRFEVKEDNMSEKFRLAFPDGFQQLKEKAWGK